MNAGLREWPFSRALLALLPLVLATVASCGDPPVLALKVLTPEGADPLVTADRVRFLVSEPARDTTLSLSDSKTFTLEEEVEVEGAVGVITLEAYDGQDTLVARGETPPMVLRPKADEMTLLVSTAGAMRTLRTRLATPAKDLTAALLPGSGVLLAGGEDLRGTPLSSASLYDFFLHRLEKVADLPAARSGAVVGICGSGCAVLGLGSDSKGLADTLLRFDGAAWTAASDGIDPSLRRRHAGSAQLSNGTVLVVGGTGLGGTLDTALLLDPGSEEAAPTLTLLDARMVTRRTSPAVAATTGAAIVAGGQEKGGAVAEIYYPSSSTFLQIALPGPALGSGAAAVELGDGRLAVLGGRDTAGTLLADAWLVDPIAVKATHLAKALPAARADHTALRLGSILVIVGGLGASGAPTKSVVLSASDLSLVAEPTMQVPRSAATVGRLGQGSFLVAAGTTGIGTLTDRIEVYETPIVR